MAEGGNIQLSSAASSDEALQLEIKTDTVSVVNVSSDSGDYETLIRTGCDDSNEHLSTDVSEVTQEARKVLEQFLKLSLGQGGLSSLEGGHAWTDVEPQYAVLDNIHKDSQPTPYQPMGSDQSLFENVALSTGDAGFFSGGAGKTIYQELAYARQCVDRMSADTGSPLAAVRQRSAPSKICAVNTGDDDRTYMPLLIRKSESNRKLHKEIVRRKSSSSSMGDYEYSDTVVTNRKRKSLLRLAKERLQRSFRHEKKKTGAPYGGEQSSTVEKDSKKTSEKSPLGKFRLGHPKHAHKISYSSSSPYEAGENVLVSGSPCHQGPAAHSADVDSSTAQDMSETGYLTGETDDALKMTSLSPSVSKKFGAKPKSKKSRDIFGGILKQFRKTSSKPTGKAKDDNNSSKVVASPAQTRASHPDDRLQPGKSNLVGSDVTAPSPGTRTSAPISSESKNEPSAQTDNDNDSEFVCPAGLPSPLALHCGTSGNPESSTQLERRSRMQLEGLVPCLPGKETKVVGMSKQDCSWQTWRMEGRNPDEPDGGRRDLKGLLLHQSSKPFSQKTDHEKDELYEHIAGQLATIAYNYTFESPQSASTKSQEATVAKSVTEGAAQFVEMADASLEQSRTCGLEASAPLTHQQASGERSPYSMIDSAPVVAELVQSTSYRCFEQIITSSIGATETGWHQIAMMFRLTQSAIVMAGMGTAVALQIKELTLKYFEDRFANWIVTQGGWESMVDETNTELDSELD